MTLKSHAKFEEKLTGGFENDMRNLANFHQNTWKCQVLSWDPFAQSRKYEIKLYREVMCNDNKEWWKI